MAPIDEELRRQVPVISAIEDEAAGNPSVTSVDASVKEAVLLSQGLSDDQIKKRAAEKEHGRTEKFRDHFEYIAIAGLWAISVLFTAVIFSWFWHYLSPVCWHWLTPEQLAKLQTLATGGIIAGIAAGHIKKRLG